MITKKKNVIIQCQNKRHPQKTNKYIRQCRKIFSRLLYLQLALFLKTRILKTKNNLAYMNMKFE